MALFSVSTEAFVQVLTNCASGGAQVYVPMLVSEQWSWRKASTEDLDSWDVSLGPARATEPVKSLFFPPRGEVSRFFGEDARAELAEQIIVGVRQCDLAALRILDEVFLEGPFVDPFYKARREKTLIISADCLEPYDVCFCSFVEGQPCAEKGFDLNISQPGDMLIVETGSEKGDKFVQEHKADLHEASEREAHARDEVRKRVASELGARVKALHLDFEDKLRHITKGKEDLPVWDARAEDCVECGACNFSCPTCHCFYLQDVEEQDGVRRFANWDSCLYPSFARVAGGANPRPRRAERLLNRFEKKFSFFVDTMDALACTGCGRCIEACAGKIDIREVLKELGR